MERGSGSSFSPSQAAVGGGRITQTLPGCLKFLVSNPVLLISIERLVIDVRCGEIVCVEWLWRASIGRAE